MHDIVEGSGLRSLVVRLNDKSAWALLPPEIEGYVQQISVLHPDADTMDIAILKTIVTNFHLDHKLVDALQTPDNPDHSTQWESIRRSIHRIVQSKSMAGSFSDIVKQDEEDLVQNACDDLWQGLPKFGYKSQLKTWVFTLTVNRIKRYIRSALAQKRSRLQTQSLDALPAGDEHLPDDQNPSPFDIASARALESHIRRVLSAHPDNRIEVIFRLWALEGRPLREIGELVDLSPVRVHTLRLQACEILRQQLGDFGWTTLDDPGPSTDS